MDMKFKIELTFKRLEGIEKAVLDKIIVKI